MVQAFGIKIEPEATEPEETEPELQETEPEPEETEPEPEVTPIEATAPDLPDMVYVGIGSCEPHASLSVLREEESENLDACKGVCLDDTECSFISYTSGSCTVFEGILCQLD